MKTCSKCHRTLPETEEFFVLNKSCKNGLAGTCRECHRAYMRSWKAENHDRLAPRRRELYAERTKDEKREKEHRRWQRAPYKMRARVLYAGMCSRARRCGVPFDHAGLSVGTIADWLQRETACPCCGVAFQIVPTDGIRSDASPSVDRFIPENGYVRGNVALICWRCNNLKRDASAAELRRVADWMDAH